jgi:putative membrane protein insertion efficiency factor
MKILLISIIRFYKYFISPILPGACRFVPSCSEYSMDAIRQYGALKGLYLSARRILRCNPFHPGGFDPVR